MATKQANKYKEKGNIAFRAGDHAKAIEYYTYATELDPNNPIFFTNRSTAYFKMKKIDKSLRDANKSIEVDANWAKGYYRKGLALMEMKQYKEALPQLEKAARIDSDNLEFSTEVARCKTHFMKDMSAGEIIKTEANKLFKIGKIDAAVEKYTQALAACQDTEKDKLVKADIYANRAACYRQVYSSQKVVRDCTECLKLNPNHPKALIRRGQAFESLEKFKEALADFERVNYLSPGTSVTVQGASRIRTALKKNMRHKL